MKTLPGEVAGPTDADRRVEGADEKQLSAFGATRTTLANRIDEIINRETRIETESTRTPRDRAAIADSVVFASHEPAEITFKPRREGAGANRRVVARAIRPTARPSVRRRE